MRRSLTAAAIALLMTTVAHADNVTDIYKGGYWTAFHTARNNVDGKSMCGAMASWTFRNGDIGALSMKWTNERGLFMHFSKSSWSFAPDIENIPLAISFDNGYREGNGFSIESATAKTPMIQINIPADNVAGFLEDFANAKTMTISFRGGTERDWIANMKGSRGAVKALQWCIGKINTTSPVGPQATSPVNPQATSPVGSKPHAKKDDGSI